MKSWDTSLPSLRDYVVAISGWPPALPGLQPMLDAIIAHKEGPMAAYYVDLYDAWVERIVYRRRQAYSFVEWNETGTAADVADSFKAAGDLRSALQRAPSRDFKLQFHFAAGDSITRWCETRRLMRQYARRSARCGAYGQIWPKDLR